MKHHQFAAWGAMAVTSVLLYGAAVFGGGSEDPRADLIFNHKFHLTEAELSCDDCHQGVAASRKEDDNLYPGMDVCATCHDVEDKTECSTCHKDPDHITPLSGLHPNYGAFQHQRHIASGKNCTDCHAGILQSKQWSAAEKLIPPMTACIDCHKREGEVTDCAICHYGNHPQPGDLDFSEWRRRHGLDAAFDPDKYQQYFEMGYCEDCHQGLNLTGNVHEPGWLFVHGDEAMSGGECFVCHEDRQECASCHRTMLPVPHTLGDPSFANQEDGGSHKNDAEAYFEACLSCHDQGSADPTCVRCH